VTTSDVTFSDWTRYETASGLTVEVDREALSIFRPGENTLVWWSPSEPTSFKSHWLSPLDGGHSSGILSFVNNAFDADPVRFASPGAGAFCPQSAAATRLIEIQPEYFLNIVDIEGVVERAARVFRPRRARIIAHRVILSGKPWLVPAYLQDPAETTARDHAIHFEEVILTREHLGLNGLPVRQTLHPRGSLRWVRSLFDNLSSLRALCSLSACSRCCAVFMSAIGLTPSSC